MKHDKAKQYYDSMKGMLWVVHYSYPEESELLFGTDQDIAQLQDMGKSAILTNIEQQQNQVIKYATIKEVKKANFTDFVKYYNLYLTEE